MLILNTLALFVQLIIIIILSLISMNIIRHFTGHSLKMALLAPAVFVNHGGGPMPLLNLKDGIATFLTDELKKHVNLNELKAIILVTAHWEEREISVSSGQTHKLYFDYYGFPPETYKYTYEAAGDPVLAAKISEVLRANGIESKLDPDRGWDHGVFVPMMLINPSANIPIIQVSILLNQDPEQHYKVGQVLHQFRKDGIAVIGSGMSYHNMREFRSMNGNKVVNKEFDDYLNRVCTADEESARREGLLKWHQQPGAADAHPPRAAEHLMPLIVVAGAGGKKAGERIFNWDMREMFRLSAFIWKHE